MRKIVFILILVLILGVGATVALATDLATPGGGAAVQAGTVQPLALPDLSTLVYVPLQPCRLVDTRQAGGGGKITAGSTRNFYAWGIGNYSGAPDCGIDPYASAIAVTLTATQEDGAGNLRAWPYGASMPTASVINYKAMTDIANTTILPIYVDSPSYDFSVYANVSGTHLVADVVGYFIRKGPRIITMDENSGTSNPACITPAYTANGERGQTAVLNGQFSLFNATSLDHCTYLAYSTDGGLTWSPANTWCSMITNPANGWATSSLSFTMDLTSGTTYQFAWQTGGAFTYSTCHLQAVILDRN